MQFLWSAFIGGLFFGLLFITVLFWINRQSAKTSQPRRALVSARTLVWLFPVMMGLIMGLVRAGLGYVIDDAELIQGSFSYGIGTTLGSLISMLVLVRRWLPTK